MAKRFTDTDKWKRQNYRKLPLKMKLAMSYLYDCCDHSGIWIVDMELISFQLGEEITQEELFQYLNDKLIPFGRDKIFLPGFIEFQYGDLQEDCKPHKRVLQDLARFGLLEYYLKWREKDANPPATLTKELANPYVTVTKELPNSSVTVEDKEKDQDQDQDQEKEQVACQKFDFESLYKKYPRKLGKKGGMRVCKAKIRSPEAFEKLSTAIDKYYNHVISNALEAKFIKYFSTFMNSWEDWLEPDVGHCNGPPRKLTLVELIEQKEREQEVRTNDEGTVFQSNGTLKANVF